MTTLLFWFLAWGLTLFVLGLLLWPLLKRHERSATEETEKRLQVYRQQVTELDQDRYNAVLTDEQYHQATCELERRLLEETKLSEAKPMGGVRPMSRRAIAVVLAVGIPAVSGVLYWKLGNPLAITNPGMTVSATSGGTDYDHRTAEGLDALAARLKNKLEQNPNDGVGWALLARSYAELGRHADAVPIYDKAMQLIPDDPQLLADYADALGMLHGRKLEGKPERLIQQALKLDPKNVKALMLAGTVAFDRKEFARAAQYWERATANLPADAEEETRQELLAGIAEAKSLAEGKPVPLAVAGGSPAPSNGNKTGAAIMGTVKLAPELAGKSRPTDTLFVFAREVNGPPMPVAIVRATAKDLPFTFQLDDTSSPMPSRKLSGLREVVVVARLSQSGDATPQRGDLQGESQPVKPGSTGVPVLINRALP